MKASQIKSWISGFAIALVSVIAMASPLPDFTQMDNANLRIEAKGSAVASRILARRMLGLDDTGKSVAKIIENEEMQAAIELLRSASTSDAIAANTLGTLIQNGVAPAKYEGEDGDLFQFAAERGDEGGQVNFAITRLFSGSPEQAVKGRKSLEDIIGNSDSDWRFVALRALSTAMLYGIGGERDIARGVEGYELFLQFYPDDAAALTVMGQAKQYGWVGEKDILAAITFYERAAASGGNSAMWQLAMIYQERQDMEKSWNLVVRSSDAGFENAMISRAVMLALGQGVEQDYTQSYNWYEKVAIKGRAHAIRALAYMHQLGQGREENPKLAWGLYKLAAPLDKIAQERLDEMQAVLDQWSESERSAFIRDGQEQAQNWLQSHKLTSEDLH